MLADLLSEIYEGNLEESGETERTAIASGRSPFASVRPVVRFERRQRFSLNEALNDLMDPSGSEYIG